MIVVVDARGFVQKCSSVLLITRHSSQNNLQFGIALSYLLTLLLGCWQVFPLYCFEI